MTSIQNAGMVSLRKALKGLSKGVKKDAKLAAKKVVDEFISRNTRSASGKLAVTGKSMVGTGIVAGVAGLASPLAKVAQLKLAALNAAKAVTGWNVLNPVAWFKKWQTAGALTKASNLPALASSLTTPLGMASGALTVVSTGVDYIMHRKAKKALPDLVKFMKEKGLNEIERYFGIKKFLSPTKKGTTISSSMYKLFNKNKMWKMANK